MYGHYTLAIWCKISSGALDRCLLINAVNAHSVCQIEFILEHCNLIIGFVWLHKSCIQRKIAQLKLFSIWSLMSKLTDYMVGI